VADDFVIAEPNDWAVTRIKQIEESLLRPEKVLPRFGKKVTGFERNLPLVEIMKIITEKRFSQFPVYDSGKFMGLITLRTIGFYFAQASLSGSVSLKGRIAEDLLLGNGKRTNFKFVSADTKVSEVEKMFQTEAILEAILITKDGHSDGNLLGIIRPRDIYSQEGEQ
jgi:predicted transcriptional regulator